MKKLKILELTNFSAGACGVWARVKEESLRLAKSGHEVQVFSSDFIKGTSNRAEKHDIIGNVKITRYKAKKLGGESFMSWRFESDMINYKPDVIFAHNYRHLHTTRALKLKKYFPCKIFLVTHAPFIEDNSTRSFPEKITVKFYDSLIGPKVLKKFDKIIAITKWEYPYLEKLDVPKEKIVYIPNGIPEEFFSQKEAKEQNRILFLGRISPIKNIEILIEALSKIEDKKIQLEIVGPAEEKYLRKLKSIVQDNFLQERIIFSNPVYNLKEKIRKIDGAKMFVLPSKREAMPQSLIEAMARKKIVIASDNPGTQDIIIDGKNGYLFPNNDPTKLAEILDICLNNKPSPSFH